MVLVLCQIVLVRIVTDVWVVEVVNSYGCAGFGRGVYYFGLAECSVTCVDVCNRGVVKCL